MGKLSKFESERRAWFKFLAKNDYYQKSVKIEALVTFSDLYTVLDRTAVGEYESSEHEIELEDKDDEENFKRWFRKLYFVSGFFRLDGKIAERNGYRVFFPELKYPYGDRQWVEGVPIYGRRSRCYNLFIEKMADGWRKKRDFEARRTIKRYVEQFRANKESAIITRTQSIAAAKKRREDYRLGEKSARKFFEAMSVASAIAETAKQHNQ